MVDPAKKILRKYNHALDHSKYPQKSDQGLWKGLRGNRDIGTGLPPCTIFQRVYWQEN